MTKDEALKLALEVIEAIHTVGDVECVVTPNGTIYLQPAITAIKEALAQPVQEPVAYAGVKVWVGNQQVVQLLTQTELHYAVEPWLLVELNALKCVKAMKEFNT